MQGYRDPRREIWEFVYTDLEGLLKEAGKLHGHYCPFLALGVKAGAKGIKMLDIEHAGMEEVMAIIESNNCFSDGIQYSTGCTFGNNSLIYKDYGKTAVTFAHRGKENGVRIVVKPDAGEFWENKYPRYSELFDKVVKNRTGDEKDSQEMMKLARKISFEVIEADSQKFFKTDRVTPEIPEYAPIFESVTCSKCGEDVMASRIVERDGKKLCIPCAGEAYEELNGSGITHRG